MKIIFVFAALVFSWPFATIAAEPLRFTSGPSRVSLIELYTSEGCSSCPPADRWLAALRGSPGLWRDFVPVAFHVSYWDYTGWSDRFSSRAFTQREYAYATAWGSKTVYTPCFVRDGAEWHPGSGAPEAPGGSPGVLTVQITGGADEMLPSSQSSAEASTHGSLSRSALGTATHTGGGNVRVEFAPGADLQREGFIVHAALLGGGLSSKVTAGENSGETLKHEFVAVAFVDKLLSSGAQDMPQHAEFTLPPPSVAGAPRQAIAIWITRRGSLDPIQAAGGWLNESRK